MNRVGRDRVTRLRATRNADLVENKRPAGVRIRVYVELVATRS